MDVTGGDGIPIASREDHPLTRVADSAQVIAARMREQDHVANVGRTGDQHDQPVYAYAAITSRQHAIFQRADVVGVVVHRFLLTRVLGCHLRLEVPALVLDRELPRQATEVGGMNRHQINNTNVERKHIRACV